MLRVRSRGRLRVRFRFRFRVGVTYRKRMLRREGDHTGRHGWGLAVVCASQADPGGLGVRGSG